MNTKYLKHVRFKDPVAGTDEWQTKDGRNPYKFLSYG